jgi:hypothetical protein
MEAGKVHARAPEAVPAKIAINAVDPGKRLRPEVRIFSNFRIFNRESGARYQTE